MIGPHYNDLLCGRDERAHALHSLGIWHELNIVVIQLGPFVNPTTDESGFGAKRHARQSEQRNRTMHRALYRVHAIQCTVGDDFVHGDIIVGVL